MLNTLSKPKRRAATAETPDLPDIRMTPEWREADKRVFDLRADLQETRRQRDAAWEELHQGRQRSRMLAQAEALARGETATDPAVLDTLAERHREFERKEQVLAKAAELAEQHLRNLRGRLSAQNRDAVMEAYRPVVKRIAKAMIELCAAVEEEKRFVARVEGAGMVFTAAVSEPMGFPHLGPAGGNGLAGHYLRRCAALGIVAPEEIENV